MNLVEDFLNEGEELTEDEDVGDYNEAEHVKEVRKQVSCVVQRVLCTAR